MLKHRLRRLRHARRSLVGKWRVLFEFRRRVDGKQIMSTTVDAAAKTAEGTTSDDSKPMPSERRRFTYVQPPLTTAHPSPGGTVTSTPTMASQQETPSTSGEAREERQMSALDFKFLRHIGEGSFSDVYLGKEVATGRLVAIKTCDKLKIKRERKVQYILREKEVMKKLNAVDSPLFVELHYTFQDSMRLYFVMTWARHGEMLDHMKRVGAFDESATRFYSAEVVLALEHLHKLGVIHRDMKPENILLSSSWHIMVSDFGSAKVLDEDVRDAMLAGTYKVPEEEGTSSDKESSGKKQASHDTDSDDDVSRPMRRERRSSFVGTAQYVSPETLNGHHVTFGADFWALGAIIYQMIAGLPPFRDSSEFLIFQRVLKAEYTFPHGFPDVPAAIVKDLLVVDVAKRLGTASIADIKSHAFFEGVNWAEIVHQPAPRLLPFLPASGDEPEHRSNVETLQESIDDDIAPGLDGQLTRLHGWGSDLASDDILLPLETITVTPSAGLPLRKNTADNSPIVLPSPVILPMTAHATSVEQQKMRDMVLPLLKLSADDRKTHMKHQREHSIFNRYVDNHLILFQGYLDKKVGFFSRNRMFLLTDGPHLYYVDVPNKERKGEVPITKALKAEAKNFKTFFLHTPNRTYYLLDKESGAQVWCEVIERVRDYYAAKTGSTQTLTEKQ